MPLNIHHWNLRNTCMDLECSVEKSWRLAEANKENVEDLKWGWEDKRIPNYVQLPLVN